MLTAKGLETACQALAINRGGKVSRKSEALNLEGTVLRAAFELVVPTNDWKAPIASTLGSEILTEHGFAPCLIARAVEFMTATPCRITTYDDGAVKFEADGYRRGPAGDH